MLLVIMGIFLVFVFICLKLKNAKFECRNILYSQNMKVEILQTKQTCTFSIINMNIGHVYAIYSILDENERLLTSNNKEVLCVLKSFLITKNKEF